MTRPENPQRGDVRLPVPGLPDEATHLILAFDMNAAARIEELYSEKLEREVSFLDIAEMLCSEKPRFALMRDLFHEALRKHHPEITVEVAGEMFARAGFSETVHALMEAMQSFVPKQKPGEPAAGEGDTPGP